MNKTRLKLAITVLEELRDSGRVQEDVDNADAERPHERNLHGDALNMRCWHFEHKCGTNACLAGWLCQDERIQAEGLRLEENGSNSYPYYEGDVEMIALEEFFDLDEDTAAKLFGQDNPNSFEAGIHRMKEVLGV